VRHTIAITLAAGSLGAVLCACGSTGAGHTTGARSSSTAPSNVTRLDATATGTGAAAPAPLIAYVGPIDGGVGIRVVRRDGTGDRGLTPGVPLRADGWQVHPDWSPDGGHLAFAADSDAVTRDLWVAAADGTGPARVFDCVLPCMEADYPSWSPDGKTLAFEAFDARGNDKVNARLSILDLDSGIARTIFTVTRDGDVVRRPRWSPDGHRLVFEIQHWSNGGPSASIRTSEIDVMAASPAGHPSPLTRPSMLATYPDWSWADGRIVFATTGGPIFTIASNGSHLHHVTDSMGGTVDQPSWTPDGKRIIFTTLGANGLVTMATIRPDGSDQEAATTSGPMFGTHPRLQPLPPG
jgi:Tol biopolymer transport system component